MTTGTDDHERRIFDRWALDGKARVILDGQSDFSCAIKDMSASGVSVDTALRPAMGDQAIIYVKGIGRMRAEVVRVSSEDVALRFLIDDERQQAIVDRLEQKVVDGIERHLEEVLASLG